LTGTAGTFLKATLRIAARNRFLPVRTRNHRRCPHPTVRPSLRRDWAVFGADLAGGV